MITKDQYYGVTVAVDKEMDELRRERCLCLNCECKDSCLVAKKFYELCKLNDIALAVTRCKLWEPNE